MTLGSNDGVKDGMALGSKDWTLFGNNEGYENGSLLGNKLGSDDTQSPNSSVHSSPFMSESIGILIPVHIILKKR